MKSEKQLAELMECVPLILADVAKVKAHVLDQANEKDVTRPLTALELCERWHVPGASAELQLFNLARKARAWGLQPLKGTRGWDALYGRADVLHAESYASGKLTRRKNAR